MYTVGIICGQEYLRSTPIRQLITKLYKEFGPTVTVLGAGSDRGGDQYVKKYALSYGVQYKEYNPGFTGHNPHSAMDEGYYAKKFHPTHFQHRYQLLLDNCEVAFFFPGPSVDPALKYAMKYAEKKTAQGKLKYVVCE